MMHELVSPFPEECLPQLWGWLAEFHRQMVDEYSPKTFAELQEKYHADHAAGGKSFAAFRATGNGHRGELLGVVWGENMGDGIFTGHMVFERDIPTQEKQAILRDALKSWGTDGARKIRWPAFADNRAYKVFLRRAGAEIEGVLRGEGRRDGQIVDTLLMASFPEAQR